MNSPVAESTLYSGYFPNTGIQVNLPHSYSKNETWESATGRINRPVRHVKHADSENLLSIPSGWKLLVFSVISSFNKVCICTHTAGSLGSCCFHFLLIIRVKTNRFMTTASSGWISIRQTWAFCKLHFHNTQKLIKQKIVTFPSS